jgi:hypothetical protein
MKALIISLGALGLIASPALATTKTSTMTTKTPAAKVTTTTTTKVSPAKGTTKKIAKAHVKKTTKSASVAKKAATKKPA